MTEEGNGFVMENGHRYRMPYRAVKEVVFNNIRTEELADQEHAARLQYRLLLCDAILFAQVEFSERRITLTYNPENADNGKERMSLQQIRDLLVREGINADEQAMNEREVDYYERCRRYFNPETIREHAPYGYTLDEWQKMRDEYEKRKSEYEDGKMQRFHAWQQEYIKDHPELASEPDTEKK